MPSSQNCACGHRASQPPQNVGVLDFGSHLSREAAAAAFKSLLRSKVARMKDAELELGSHAQGKYNEHLQRLALASAGDAGRAAGTASMAGSAAQGPMQRQQIR
jgi:hypothetical protein